MSGKLKPPKVRGWPLVGSLPQLWRGNLGFLRSLRERHGDVYRLDFGDTEVTMLAHPRHAQRVLRENVSNYLDKGDAKGFRAGHYPLMQQGLATVSGKGKSWRDQRLLVQPQFRPKNLGALTETMSEAVSETLERWENDGLVSEPIDLEREMTRMTMNVIGRALFGTPIGPQESDRVSAAIRYTFGYTWWATLGQALPWMPMPGRRRYRQAIDEVYAGVAEIFDRSVHSQSPAQNSEQEHEPVDHLIGHLWRAARAGGDEEEARAFLRVQAVTLLITGYESTAATLAWAFHLLPRHPEVLAKLEDEIEVTLAGREPTFDDLLRLPYTRMVVQETLRLYAPSHWIQRTAEADDEIDGFAIPAGSIVAPMIHLIHYHPDLWPEPERFVPERFSAEQSAGRPDLAFLPFGAGPRMCLAEGLAMTKTVLILARVLQRYQVTAVPGREPGLLVGTNVRAKGGVWATLERRVQ